MIAHEVGHHVQNLLGTSDKVDALRGRVDKVEYNRLSVRLELQADFFAGVWAHHAQKMKNILEPGDIDEALRAAHADRRRPPPEADPAATSSPTPSPTAPPAAGRWFKKGFQTGDIKQGDTFNMPDPTDERW